MVPSEAQRINASLRQGPKARGNNEGPYRGPRISTRIPREGETKTGTNSSVFYERTTSLLSLYRCRIICNSGFEVFEVNHVVATPGLADDLGY